MATKKKEEVQASEPVAAEKAVQEEVAVQETTVGEAPEVTQSADLVTSDEAAKEAPETQTEAETTEEPIIKSGFKKVKASGFRGAYKDARFDDEGIGEVSDVTLAELRIDFPGIEIEELD